MLGFAAGPFNAAYEQRIDFAALRRKRVERVREEMRRAGLDALLVWKDENVRYLTDLRAQQIAGKSSFLNGALLLGQGTPILFCSGGEVDRVRRMMSWIPHVHPIPIMEDPGLIDAFVRHQLAPLFRDHGLSRARLGMDAAPLAMVHAIARHLPEVELADGDVVMQRARWIKFPEEIAALEEATAIADAVIATAAAAVREGIRECEVAGEALRTLLALGGEYAHVMTPFVASGERMAPPNRFATDKLIRYGDVVFIDIGACWNGYYADVGRTVVCGRPSPEQRRIFTAVYEALQACIETMRPGRTNEEAAGGRQGGPGSGPPTRTGGPPALALHWPWHRDRGQRAPLHRRAFPRSPGGRIPARDGLRRRASDLGGGRPGRRGSPAGGDDPDHRAGASCDVPRPLR